MSRSLVAAVKRTLLALMLLQQRHRQSDAAAVQSSDGADACPFKAALKNAPAYASRMDDGRPDGAQTHPAERIGNVLAPFDPSSPDGRGKKNKNIGPVLAAGAAVMAGTLTPIAFGALFALAGKAIITSLVAITVSGLLGLKALFGKHQSSGHVKAYPAAPSPHHSEAQFEHELGVYGAPAEAKTRKPAAGLSGYYEGERHGAGSDQPEYYAGAEVRRRARRDHGAAAVNGDG